ncbi:hypothetical protein AB9A97_11945 [Escherichia coli]
MSKKIDISNALFDTELNDYCRKYIMIGETQLTKQDIIDQPKKLQNIRSKLCEGFILNEKLNFKVYGENVPLAFLVNEIGLYDVERLIDQEALSFSLWTANVGYISSPIPGTLPLVSMRFNSTVHTDPEESISTGLSVLRKGLKPGEKRNLIKKLRDNYLDIPKGLEKDCVDMTISALNSGKLNQLGIDLTKEKLTDLSLTDKKKLGKVAEELFNFKYLVNKKARPHITDNVSAIISQALITIDKNEIFKQISLIENFPDLRKSFIEMGLPMNDIMRLRNDRHAKKFRKWLKEAEQSSSASDISKYYIDSISNSKGFFDSFLGRSTKSIAMMLTGALAASNITSPLAPVVGSIGGLLLQPTLDYALDMVDEYLISELTKGWNPRMFFNHINNHIEKYKLSLD